MPEGDVLYSDLVFVKSRGNGGKDAALSSSETNYALVKEAKTQLEPQHGKTTVRAKLTSERVALVALCVFLVLALVALCYVFYQNVQIKKKIQNLKAEREEWKASQSETMNSVCWRCDPGWELHGESCYWFSTSTSTWELSRYYCRLQSSDLVKIDSHDEQSFVERKLRDKMVFQEDKFWIGLTDSKEEDQWLWVDGSPLNLSLKFWGRNEPDNWSREGAGGEDCVRMGEKDGAHDLLCWFDKACDALQKSICEKTAQRGRSLCNFL
ncbi:C-type lectin domain family 4 member E-like [Hippocampus comes]|uniref:C-type lectin domain family 4 member E-like n=1 Tax=Hippocampus comes TaxID=109280 RepID=UPI00094EE9EC|nr:PREDICTED: C-type lectin domain family 4 member E-like [Hippocampus comes]